MRWTPGGESQDIEDRRDDSGGGGGGFQFGGRHVGIGGAILLLILSFVFKTNFFALVGGGGSVGNGGSGSNNVSGRLVTLCLDQFSHQPRRKDSATIARLGQFDSKTLAGW